MGGVSQGRSTREHLWQRGHQPVDVRRGGPAGQRDPHVAVGERAHRGQHVRRLEAAGGARRPRRHREPAPVELGDQGLPVDVQAGEGQHVRQPGHRVADDVHVVQPVQRRPEPVDERVLAGADLLALGDDGLQRGGGGERGRDVLEAGHPGVGPVVGGERRPPPGALAHQQHPDAGRAAPLVRRRGGRGPPARQVHPPGGRAGVGEDGHVVPRGRLGDLRPRLERADLRVRHLYGGHAGRPAGQRLRPGRRAARAPARPRAPPSVVPEKWRVHHAPADSTAECSTAVCTSRGETRRRPSSRPRTPRCTAAVPEEVKLTSSGRAPSRVATTSRALSSSSRASRPAPCSRSGSAQPRSRALSRVSRAAGCRASVDTASR